LAGGEREREREREQGVGLSSTGQRAEALWRLTQRFFTIEAYKEGQHC
jgi:hypothetical protein